jgi:hypothetical protein
MMHLLQFPKNVHFLQEAAAVVDAVDTVEIVAAADEAVAADVHSVEAAAEVVHLLAEDAADHVVAVKLEAEAVQAVHANLNNKLCKSPESLMRFRTFLFSGRMRRVYCRMAITLVGYITGRINFIYSRLGKLFKK